jgi:hypothetical protein
MPITNFPGGVSSFGVPQLGTIPALIPRNPGLGAASNSGAVYFVDNVNGTAGATGLDPNNCLNTIQAAVNKAQNSGNTTIYVFGSSSDYDENVVVSVRGVMLVGVSTSCQRVTISPTTGIPLRVRGGLTQGSSGRAHNFSAYNMDFHAQDGSAAVQQQANRFLLQNCQIASDSGIALRLLPNNLNDSESASEGLVQNCIIRQSDVGCTFENPGPSAGGTGGTGVTGTIIDNCYFYGNTNQDVKDVDTAGSNDACFGASSASPQEQCFISNCYFGDRAKAVYITLTNGGINCGLISNLRFAMDGAGRLTSTQVAIATAIVATEIYDATGLVDAHAF